jgi:hypothetical protein
MENDALKRISDFLSKNGTSVDTISKSRLAQFEKVDAAIQARLGDVHKAQELLKSNPINVSTIAGDTSIARKTFYNNELLRLYVEKYSCTTDEKTASAGDLDRYRARCEELERQVRQFLLRDFETENLRHENMKLQIEIKNLESRNVSLETQYEELQVENNNLRKQASERKPIILSFNKDTN